MVKNLFAAEDTENFLGIMSASGFLGTEQLRSQRSEDPPERGVLVRMAHNAPIAALALPIMHK